MAVKSQAGLAKVFALEPPAKLVWINDDRPGIRRERKGDGFAYRDAHGKAVRQAEVLRRIRSLAIPPAYEDVWISPLANGHLQATGRDARGRKQYRYHPQWRAERDADKFRRMLEFGRALPKLRARVKVALDRRAEPVPTRETVLATLVRLLDTTLVRVGNEEYARENRSFGLTTLRNRHAAVEGSVLKLAFRGKSGVQREVSLDDPRVARVVRRCQAMPGQELFQYEEDGARHGVDSADVNDWIREAAGEDFTAKDFRTWHATVLALEMWQRECGVEPKARRSANQLIAEVAQRLGNTVAVCKKSYVHPRVLETLATKVGEDEDTTIATTRRAGLDAAERRLLAFLVRGARKPRVRGGDKGLARAASTG